MTLYQLLRTIDWPKVAIAFAFGLGITVGILTMSGRKTETEIMLYEYDGVTYVIATSPTGAVALQSHFDPIP
ncbi:MAG TPA: hypothetical protein VLA24_05070 [Pseudomonadales bacterium]|nr:hypothetical protein [Pseudomonadales bacterium]